MQPPSARNDSHFGESNDRSVQAIPTARLTPPLSRVRSRLSAPRTVVGAPDLSRNKLNQVATDRRIPKKVFGSILGLVLLLAIAGCLGSQPTGSEVGIAEPAPGTTSPERRSRSVEDEFAKAPTPLFAAISASDADAVTRALAAGADPNVTFRRSTPLGWALNRDVCVPKIIRALVAAGANIEGAVWPTGQSPLSLAASRGHRECSLALIELGASTTPENSKEGTVLIDAVRPGMIDVVDYLLRHGVDANARPAGGWSALMTAAFFGDRRIVDRLIVAGGDPCVRDGRDELSAADIAGRRGFHDLASYLQGLCEPHGAHGI
jgi:ankyrin repeat protein